GHGAAELGPPPVTASTSGRAVARGAGHRRIGAPRPQHVGGRGGHEGAADHGGTTEKASPARSRLEKTSGALDQALAHRVAALNWGSSVRSRYTTATPNPTKARYGIPVRG